MGRLPLWIIGLALATGISCTSAALAREPVALAPTEPWRVHYADDSCLMVRSFGQEDDKVAVRFEQTAPGHQFSVTLIGKSLKASEPFTPARQPRSFPLASAIPPSALPRERPPIQSCRC